MSVRVWTNITLVRGAVLRDDDLVSIAHAPCTGGECVTERIISIECLPCGMRRILGFTRIVEHSTPMRYELNMEAP